MPDNLIYPVANDSLPDASFRWLDASGNPIDFTTGWTFQMKIGQPPNSAKIVKTSGMTGSNGASGSANLNVSWSASELSQLTPGRWYFQINATYGGTSKVRTLTGSIRIEFPTL